MGDVDEKLRGFLKEIKANQKKLKVQISVVLKKVEDYLFETKPTFTENQIKVLFLGDVDYDQQGLLHLCGTKGRSMKGKLKKSSFYALRILLRLLTESKQKEEFITFLTDLEDDEFGLIKLGQHIDLIDQTKDETSLMICQIIYERRRFLSLDVYVDSKEAQVQFAKWYEESQKEAKAKQAEEPETWQQDAERDNAQEQDLEHENAMKFMTLIKKRRQHINEFDELNFDRDYEFFMRTFQDPMITKQQAEEYSFALAFKGKKKKKKKGKKDVEIPYIADRDMEQYKGLIEQLHIDSEKFEPFVLLETFHSTTPEFLMGQAIEKIDSDIVLQIKYKESLMIFYINEFAKCERILSGVQDSFLIPESSFSKGMTVDIMNRLQEILTELLRVAEPILVPKRIGDKVTTCLYIYEKMKHIIYWPEHMKEALMKRSLVPIIKTYESNIECLQQHADLPVFKQVSSDIQKLTRELHKQILTAVTIKEKKASVIVDAIKNLFTTEYPNDPVEVSVQKLFDEIAAFISNYFSSSNMTMPKENVDFYSNRKSVYMQSLQNLDNEEASNHYKSLADLYEDGDGLSEYLDNYVETQTERRIKKFYFQKKNLENFINDFLDSVDLFYCILNAIRAGELRQQLVLPEAKLQQYENKTIEMVQQCINDIWNSVFNNIQSYVDYSAKLLGTRKRSLKKTLHNDLLSLGKSLANIDEYLMDRQIKRDEFRNLKLKTIEIFLKEIHNTFITEEITKVKYRENSFLILDFEGNPFSEFMHEVTAVLEKNITEIRNLSVFKGFEPAKAKILANYFASIFMNFIKVMRKKLVEEELKPEQKNDQNTSINILLGLTNLKYMVDFYFEQMANKYCVDLNIYDEDDFRVTIIAKLKAFFPDQLKELKSLYIRAKKEVMKEIFQELFLSEFVDKKKGKYIVESKFSESYKHLVLCEKEFPQIRYYIVDILLQLVISYEELMNYASFTQTELLKVVVEETSSVYFNAIRLIANYSKNIDEYKQIWYEIEFFENVTSKFQSEKSQVHIKEAYKELVRAKATIENIDPKIAEMFTLSEMSNKKILIVKTKFQYQKQFEVLYN